MQQSATVKKLLAAMADAFPKIINPLKSCYNTFHNSHYANLESHLLSVKAELLAAGILLHQVMDSEGEVIYLYTRLWHIESEEYIGGKVPLPMGAEKGKATGQVVGSLNTYLRRYAIETICMIVGQADDDGNADRHGKETVAPPAKSPAAAAAKAPASGPPAKNGQAVPKTITKEQWIELGTLAEKNGASIDKILAVCKVQRGGQIEQGRVESIKRAILARDARIALAPAK